MGRLRNGYPSTTLDEAFEAFVMGVDEVGPTARELAEMLMTQSSSTGHYWIRELAAAGLIEEGRHRNNGHYYRLTDKGRALARKNRIQAVPA